MKSNTMAASHNSHEESKKYLEGAMLMIERANQMSIQERRDLLTKVFHLTHDPSEELDVFMGLVKRDSYESHIVRELDEQLLILNRKILGASGKEKMAMFEEKSVLEAARGLEILEIIGGGKEKTPEAKINEESGVFKKLIGKILKL